MTDDRRFTPLERAWHDFVEKVGIAGWREAFSEKIVWIRAVFRICLFSLSIVCVYKAGQSVYRFAASGYGDRISDVSELDSLPFSNVTICAQIYFNQTYIRETVAIPERVRAGLRHRGVSIDEFYRQLTLYLSMTSRPRMFSPLFEAYFAQVLKANAQIADFSTFFESATPPCHQMLRRCWFDGREFDCCQRAVQSVDDDGVCYLVMVNFDSDNAFPDPRTYRQVRPGAAGGLIIEAILDVAEFPTVEDDAQNGFRILVDPTPITALGRPVAAPHLAETYVKVSAYKHALISKCSDRGRLSSTMTAGEPYMYHDPEGHSFFFREFIRLVRDTMSCDIVTYTFKPNRSTVCKPQENYIAAMVTSSSPEALFRQFFGDPDQFSTSGMLSNAARSFSLGFEKREKECVDRGMANMIPHCTYWTYESRSSFNSIDYPELPSKVIYSKIYVYYGELGHRQSQQYKTNQPYLAFCDIGNVLVLYWGISVAGFVHLLVYVPKYFLYLCMQRYERRKNDRRWDTRIRTVRVAPIGQADVTPSA